MSPLTGERKKEVSQRWEAKRRKSYTRLRIALRVLEEYGCLWEYEMACADEGIEDPLLVPEKKDRRA